MLGGNPLVGTAGQTGGMNGINYNYVDELDGLFN